MIEITLMDPSNETENKLRWQAYVKGVRFKLYIPKWRVPPPWPKRIIVGLTDSSVDGALAGESTLAHGTTPSIDLELPIVACVERIDDHTATVRFRPVGDQNMWEIGEPYIPYSLLPGNKCQKVQIGVRWDRSAGTWSES
jgi:hypothetical protein